MAGESEFRPRLRALAVKVYSPGASPVKTAMPSRLSIQSEWLPSIRYSKTSWLRFRMAGDDNWKLKGS